jgi:monoterpene epsilon-lactone hydrolase
MESILNKVDAARAFFNSLGDYYPADSSVEITSQSIEGVSCYWFTPSAFEDRKIIIYLHGGMFGLGSLQSHKAMVSHFASTLSSRILFVEYALSPERPFPGGLNDAYSVYRELARKFPDERISIIGDSAGGGLSISLINRVMEDGLPLPAKVVMISPWLNLKCDTQSHETRKELDQILTKEMLLEYASYYAAGNWDEADPGQLHFTNFPPLLILVGSNEILFDDSRLFYEKIKTVQPTTRLKEYIGQGHVWLLVDIEAESSQKALSDVSEFLSNFS